jgi:hypothetical protein
MPGLEVLGLSLLGFILVAFLSTLKPNNALDGLLRKEVGI